MARRLRFSLSASAAWSEYLLLLVDPRVRDCLEGEMVRFQREVLTDPDIGILQAGGDRFLHSLGHDCGLILAVQYQVSETHVDVVAILEPGLLLD
ncbi:MAG: hypothetical protein MH204_02990 [Fimbriimonadaceae bacterium]|nr:hypothetical protein [Fimbriimonadaceae bacterium]